MDENNDNILNQDTWQPVAPTEKGGYVIVDLNKIDLNTISFNKRFRQGENGAELKLWFYDGSIPHALDPAKSSVALYGEDSNSQLKVVTAQAGTDWQSGRVDMFLPSQVFASSGQYKRCVIQVSTNDQVLASINFNLDVLPNDFYNISIGSKAFSSQIDDSIVKTLQDFADKADQIALKADTDIAKYQQDANALKATTEEIKKNVADADVITKTDFSNGISAISNTAYSSNQLMFQAPFSMWNGAGSSDLIVGNGVVHLTIGAISSGTGSVICTLPANAIPKNEKYGVGLSMNNDGHDAQPVFISITPGGRVIVQNDPHSYSKIIVQTTYSLQFDPNGSSYSDSEKSDESDGGAKSDSLIKNQYTPTNNSIVGIYKSVNVMDSTGKQGRALQLGGTFLVDSMATMNGKQVARVANGNGYSEWVYTDDVALSWSISQGVLKTTSSTPSGYAESGQSISLSLDTTIPYAFNRQMKVNGATAYRVATNQYIDASYVNIV